MRRVLLLVVAAMALARVAPAAAATPAALLRCQKAVATRSATFVKLVHTALSSCTSRVESCQLAQEIDGEDPTACLASASAACATYSAKVSAYATASSKVAVACAAVPLPEARQWIAGLGFAAAEPGCGATTVAELVECLFDDARCAAERALFTLDPRAADALAAGGVAAAHPCVGP